MEFGTVVRFPDHPRPFLIWDECCSNPQCTCQEVNLKLLEISDRGEQVPRPISFQVRVDLETWQECNPPSRPARMADWVRQPLAKFPADRRRELRARFDQAKQTAQRMAEYTIDPQEIVQGRLFSYSQLLSDDGALSHGGSRFAFRFDHRGREYLVEDLYCPNPACDCREVLIQFWKYKLRKHGDQSEAHVSQLFLGRVTFSGRQEIADVGDASAAEANEAFAAWWDRYHAQLPMLKDRYRQVKEIGKRSLDAADAAMPALPPSSPRRGASPPVSEKRFAAEALADRKRVGRNEPCPCGSGKKFKKCCGRKAQQPV